MNVPAPGARSVLCNDEISRVSHVFSVLMSITFRGVLLAGAVFSGMAHRVVFAQFKARAPAAEFAGRLKKPQAPKLVAKFGRAAGYGTSDAA